MTHDVAFYPGARAEVAETKTDLTGEDSRQAGLAPREQP